MSVIEKQFSTNVKNVMAIDIATMESLSIGEYSDYLREEGLFYLDHHEVFRSSGAGFPIATSKKQLETLIKYLESIKHRMY